MIAIANLTVIVNTSYRLYKLDNRYNVYPCPSNSDWLKWFSGFVPVLKREVVGHCEIVTYFTGIDYRLSEEHRPLIFETTVFDSWEKPLLIIKSSTWAEANYNHITQVRKIEALFEQNLGFTLVEVLVATLLIGILAGLAIPSYLQHVNSARELEAKQLLNAIVKAEKAYRNQNDSFEYSDLSKFDTVKKQKYFDISLAELDRGEEAVWITATPRISWRQSLKSFASAVILFVENGQSIIKSITCQSAEVTGKQVQKGSLVVVKNTPICSNGAQQVK